MAKIKQMDKKVTLNAIIEINVMTDIAIDVKEDHVIISQSSDMISVDRNEFKAFVKALSDICNELDK